jgi:hypothetical protein
MRLVVTLDSDGHSAQLVEEASVWRGARRWPSSWPSNGLDALRPNPKNSRLFTVTFQGFEANLFT